MECSAYAAGGVEYDPLLREHFLNGCKDHGHAFPDRVHIRNTGHKDQEFIAPDPGQDILPAKLPVQHIRNISQHHVPEHMAPVVIDLFKIIHIQDQERIETAVKRLFQHGID